MFDKLFEARQKAEEIKKRMDQTIVTGEAEGGVIKVTATANKEVTNVFIDQVFLSKADKEEIEELLAVAINHAMRQADSISQAEAQAITRDLLDKYR
ncbi:hypothetical protein SAMN05421747_10814 [Parapedobacter composti]|uniref:Nucleoid-associated protein n=1 Tax=Parapedobacter composti TaxID=623281 RepID=A0A1I1I2U6_9SPHI|nr:YbaB/EbfC family nucleoid-associated protein [Parapedobacter composti]SFC30355.1 hypothetical protein SAMN05421747_10814 [Parapedobacter composti]